MAKNTVNTVQETLAQTADKLSPAPLDDILKAAEAELGVGVNAEWAAEALRSRGFDVADLPDRLVTVKR